MIAQNGGRPSFAAPCSTIVRSRIPAQLAIETCVWPSYLKRGDAAVCIGLLHREERVPLLRCAQTAHARGVRVAGAHNPGGIVICAPPCIST
jgi:hypothetical protein